MGVRTEKERERDGRHSRVIPCYKHRLETAAT